MKNIMLLPLVCLLHAPIVLADLNTDEEDYFSDPNNAVSLPDPLLQTQENEEESDNDG